MSKLLSNNEVNEKMNILSKNWSIDGLFLKGSYEFKNFDQAFNFMKSGCCKMRRNESPS